MLKRTLKYGLILVLGFTMYLGTAFAATYTSATSFHRIYYRDNKPSYTTFISFYGGIGNKRAAITPHKEASKWLTGNGSILLSHQK